MHIEACRADAAAGLVGCTLTDGDGDLRCSRRCSAWIGGWIQWENCDAPMAADQQVEGGDEEHSVDEGRRISRGRGDGKSSACLQLISKPAVPNCLPWQQLRPTQLAMSPLMESRPTCSLSAVCVAREKDQLHATCKSRCSAPGTDSCIYRWAWSIWVRHCTGFLEAFCEAYSTRTGRTTAGFVPLWECADEES